MTSMKAVLDFLSDLRNHNEKAWFDEHRKAYEIAKSEFEGLVAQLIAEIGEFEDLGNLAAKDCVMRIFRDVRFSKDKSPYRSSMAASIAAGGRKSTKMGYYVHVEPTNQTIVAGGLYMPSSAQLAQFRDAIDQDAETFREIIEAPDFKKHFGAIQGKSLKSAPQGYTKDHPEIELLKMKQILVMRQFSDEQVVSAEFPKLVVQTCKAMKPFNDYLNALGK
jgi:uncharacterized protein (TIGR02453 family)